MDKVVIKEAAIRAVIGAVIVGSLGFLSIWSQTDDTKVLISAGLTPALSYLAVRLGIEGYIDAKNGKS